MGNWTLLTGHGQVLVEIARTPRARIRDIATVGLSQRTVQAIIADLEAAGYLTRTRSGRRTVSTIHPDRPFRHPAQDGHRIGPLLELLAARAALGGSTDAWRRWTRVAGSWCPGQGLEATAATGSGSASPAGDGRRGNSPWWPGHARWG